MTYDEFQAALKETDERMKRNNGHQYIHILKTRCANCGASPKRKTRCGGWFRTFTNQLGVVLQERGVITKVALMAFTLVTLTGCQTPQPDPERPPVEYSER